MQKVIGALAVLAMTASVAIAKPSTKPAKSSAPTKVVLTCPVLHGKIASPKDAAGYTDYKGVRYYFCCAGCKPQFDKNPAKYIAKLPKGVVQPARH